MFAARIIVAVSTKAKLIYEELHEARKKLLVEIVAIDVMSTKTWNSNSNKNEASHGKLKFNSKRKQLLNGNP
jgi:hypothetical protein